MVELTLIFPSRKEDAGRKDDADYVFIGGVDVGGTYLDGTQWRFTGNAFQTLVYDGVSQDAAEFFDAIIDTLCDGPE